MLTTLFSVISEGTVSTISFVKDVLVRIGFFLRSVSARLASPPSRDRERVISNEQLESSSQPEDGPRIHLFHIFGYRPATHFPFKPPLFVSPSPAVPSQYSRFHHASRDPKLEWGNFPFQLTPCSRITAVSVCSRTSHNTSSRLVERSGLSRTHCGIS